MIFVEMLPYMIFQILKSFEEKLQLFNFDIKILDGDI